MTYGMRMPFNKIKLKYNAGAKRRKCENRMHKWERKSSVRKSVLCPEKQQNDRSYFLLFGLKEG